MRDKSRQACGSITAARPMLPYGTPTEDRLGWTNPRDFSERLRMKSFDSRTYSINDFVEWSSAKALELNPAFQRRSVWSDKAKSYLMDTILRGKPIPKVFIRQRINVTTRTSIRDVVDGQQRLRTILAFISDAFAVSKAHNSEFGGLRFSQLSPEVQAQILSYEITVDLLINLPDSEVLDIFGRLNSYAVILNEQELINASHFGSFKIVSDDIGRKYNSYWIKQKIFSSSQVLRMQEVSLVADLIIAMLVGIKAKKAVRRYYGVFEKDFEYNSADIERNFDDVMSKITELFPDGLAKSTFSLPFVFYTLFTSVSYCLHGRPIVGIDRVPLEGNMAVAMVRNRLDRIELLLDIKDPADLPASERTFLIDSRRATTDESQRMRRTEFLLRLMSGQTDAAL